MIVPLALREFPDVTSLKGLHRNVSLHLQLHMMWNHAQIFKCNCILQVFELRHLISFTCLQFFFVRLNQNWREVHVIPHYSLQNSKKSEESYAGLQRTSRKMQFASWQCSALVLSHHWFAKLFAASFVVVSFLQKKADYADYARYIFIESTRQSIQLKYLQRFISSGDGSVVNHSLVTLSMKLHPETFWVDHVSNVKSIPSASLRLWR